MLPRLWPGLQVHATLLDSTISDLKTQLNWALWHRPIIPSLRTWKEDQEVKVRVHYSKTSLGYTNLVIT